MRGSAVDYLVVMQPTFLPWAGFFNLIAQADVFVFLDDVQLEKQSWQTRNKLLFSEDADWISLPIKHSHLKQTIQETRITADHRWLRKTILRFDHAYKKHAHYQDALEIFNLLDKCINMNLSSLNETIILHISDRLELNPIFYRSSNLSINGDRSERLAELCKYFNANKYLSPRGSEKYLTEDKFTAKTSTELRFQEFTPPKYEQKGSSKFISHLSIVDVIANLGWKKTSMYVNGAYE